MPQSVGTHFIRRMQAENVFHAVRFATAAGAPMNVLITVNFSDLGIDESEAGPLFRAVRKSLVRWWAYERSVGRARGPFIDAYSHANPHNRRHVHWLVSIPPQCRHRFESALRCRLQRSLHVPSVDPGLHIRGVTAVGKLTRYILRGVEPAYANYFHMWSQNEGLVSGRGRTGTSRSVGRATRKQAGWCRG